MLDDAEYYGYYDYEYDDYYDDGFGDYVPTSRDPGPYMLIGVVGFAGLCILLLPIAVKARKSGLACLGDAEGDGDEEDSREDEDLLQPLPETLLHEKRNSLNFHSQAQKEVDIEEGSISSISSNMSIRHIGHRGSSRRGRRRLEVIDLSVDNSVSNGDKSELDSNTSSNDCDTKEVLLAGTEVVDDKLEEGGVQKRRSVGRGWIHFLVDIARYDGETKEIMKLCGPLTLSTVCYDIFDAISTALISRHLGVDALAAYIVSNLLIGLSECLIDGVGSALSTLCSHAIGMKNFKLAGQYVQIAGVFYFIFSIPTMGVWWFMMDDCIRLFRMNEKVAQMGLDYTRVVIFHYIFEGAFDGYSVLLDINGQVLPATLFDIVMSFADMAATWLLVTKVEGVTLYQVGISQLAVSLVSFVLFTMVSYFMGWLDPFLPGLIGSFAMKNFKAVKMLVTTSIPLSLGYVLTYGEWEALTFIAAFLGPAEVAAWGLLESIWGLLESAVNGASEAGAIRLSLHLGKGNIVDAKRCTWKSLFICSCFSLAVTILLYFFKVPLVHWYTYDETLRSLVLETIPMVGFGNILMVFGMVSWSMVGAQGRYALSTTINAILSFGLTLPLAGLFCVVHRLSLVGLVGAIVIGYSTVGLCFAYILLTSDWESISKNIQESNAETADEEDEDSDSGSDTDDEDEDSAEKDQSKDGGIGVNVTYDDNDDDVSSCASSMIGSLQPNQSSNPRQMSTLLSKFEWNNNNPINARPRGIGLGEYLQRQESTISFAASEGLEAEDNEDCSHMSNHDLNILLMKTKAQQQEIQLALDNQKNARIMAERKRARENKLKFLFESRPFSSSSSSEDSSDGSLALRRLESKIALLTEEVQQRRKDLASR